MAEKSESLLQVTKAGQVVGEAAANEAALSDKLLANPTDSAALYRLGVLYYHEGLFDNAARFLRAATEQASDRFDAHATLGLVLKTMGNIDAAIVCYRRAIELKPDMAALHYNLGNALLVSGHLDPAVEAFRQALVVDPSLAEAYNGMAEVFRARNDIGKAVENYHKAIELKPDYAEAYNRLGAAHFSVGDWNSALAGYSAAARVAPSYADAFANMGAVLFNLAEDEKSILCSRSAIELVPDFVEAHFCLAVSMLCVGNFEEGLREYEWRRRRKNYLAHDFPVPLWDGGDITGKTILLYGEQGFGDAIHFARYATTLADDFGARVILGAMAPLVRLLKTVPGVAEVCEFGQPLPPFDVHLPLLSAAYMVGTRLETIPAPKQYVYADEDETEGWSSRLSHFPGLKVGLVWAGASSNPVDARRSLKLEDFSSIVSLNRCSFFSLQKDRGEQTVSQKLAGMGIVDFTDELEDFSDTAALVNNLDLVITVDTAVAHLAGAMGKPVWVLTRGDNDWRWMRQREDSPWYPSVRLYRQTIPGDWGDVIARVGEDLAKVIDGAS